MIPSITPQKLRFTAFSGLMGLLLVSCGSYEQASYYDNDGIYSRGTERVVVTESRNPQPAAQQGGDDDKNAPDDVGQHENPYLK